MEKKGGILEGLSLTKVALEEAWETCFANKCQIRPHERTEPLPISEIGIGDREGGGRKKHVIIIFAARLKRGGGGDLTRLYVPNHHFSSFQL